MVGGFRNHQAILIHFHLYLGFSSLGQPPALKQYDSQRQIETQIGSLKFLHPVHRLLFVQFSTTETRAEAPAVPDGWIMKRAVFSVLQLWSIIYFCLLTQTPVFQFRNIVNCNFWYDPISLCFCGLCSLWRYSCSRRSGISTTFGPSSDHLLVPSPISIFVGQIGIGKHRTEFRHPPT